jgi:hypothetical protein
MLLAAPLLSLVAGVVSRREYLSTERDLRNLTLLRMHASFVLTLGALAVANQLAAMVHDEARLKRSSLLRVGGLDGAKAVASFASIGIVFSVLLGTLGYVGALLATFSVGVPAGSWIPVSGVSVLFISAVGPPAILCGFLLPRVLGLVGVSLAAIAWGGASAFLVTDPRGRAFVPWLLVYFVISLAALSYLWRRLSSRLW